MITYLRKVQTYFPLNSNNIISGIVTMIYSSFILQNQWCSMETRPFTVTSLGTLKWFQMKRVITFQGLSSKLQVPCQNMYWFFRGQFQHMRIKDIKRMVCCPHRLHNDPRCLKYWSKPPIIQLYMASVLTLTHICTYLKCKHIFRIN